MCVCVCGVAGVGGLQCIFPLSKTRELRLGKSKQFVQSLYPLIWTQCRSAKHMSALSTRVCIPTPDFLFLSLMVKLVEVKAGSVLIQRKF